MTKVISYRESPENIAALDKLCVATERDRGYHLRKALAAYLAANEWQMGGPRPNRGHGHVYPRADGIVAKCGGPGICKECNSDQAQKSNSKPASDGL